MKGNYYKIDAIYNFFFLGNDAMYINTSFTHLHLEWVSHSHPPEHNKERYMNNQEKEKVCIGCMLTIKNIKFNLFIHFLLTEPATFSLKNIENG